MSSRGIPTRRIALTVLCAAIYTAIITGIVALLGGPMAQTWICVFFGADLPIEWRYWGEH